MNYLLFILKSAFFDFSRNKGRTFLTSLGIMIGVLSVVLLIAFGLGLKAYIEEQFNSLGTNLLRVFPGQVIQNGQFRAGGGALGSIRFDERDVQRLKLIAEAEFVIPVSTKTATASYGGVSEVGDMYMTTEGIFAAINLTPLSGELFTQIDVEKRSKVVVMGPKIAEKLFGSTQAAVGNAVTIENQKFKVVGVVEAKGTGFGGPDLDSYLYVPYTASTAFNPDKKFSVIIIKGYDDGDLAILKDEVQKVLSARYKEEDFSIVEQTEILNAVTSIFAALNSVLVAIAAISLVVGGIGIMNIMYVTVSERTREIGIRRAIGARRSDILSQFIVESVLLSCFGGFLGIALAYIIVFFIHPYFPAYINIQSVLLAFGVSSAIGILFGVFPAKKAADLSPMEAIRYE